MSNSEPATAETVQELLAEVDDLRIRTFKAIANSGGSGTRGQGNLEKQARDAANEATALRYFLRQALYPTTGSNMVKFASDELDRAGLFDPESDYNGTVGRASMDLVSVLASYRPSGGMAGAIRVVFSALSNFEPLGFSDHSTWEDMSHLVDLPEGTFLQDSRDSRWMSNNGGKSWFHVDALEPSKFAILDEDRDPRYNRPKVVTLCGSTRFGTAYDRAMLEETLNGNIVLTIGTSLTGDFQLFSKLSEALRDELKARLDGLHYRKIDVSDEVLVLNVDGYVGWSTNNEIQYSLSKNKKVRFLEPESVPEGGYPPNEIPAKP